MQGRLPFQRRCGVARSSGGYIRHGDPERAAVRIARTKGSEYERLKDFNENIVESVNVGVMAVDLQDRNESWNSQMEVMYGQPRWQVVGRSLSEVFSGRFVEEFYRVGDSGHPQSL